MVDKPQLHSATKFGISGIFCLRDFPHTCHVRQSVREFVDDVVQPVDATWRAAHENSALTILIDSRFARERN